MPLFNEALSRPVTRGTVDAGLGRHCCSKNSLMPTWSTWYVQLGLCWSSMNLFDLSHWVCATRCMPLFNECLWHQLEYIHNVPLDNDEKNLLNFSDYERNRNITRVPQGRQPDALAGCTTNAPSMCCFSMNTFHANALESCAMNALGMCRSSMSISTTWVTEYVPLSVRQTSEPFSAFAGTGTPHYSSQRPWTDCLAAPLDGPACPERSAREELGCHWRISQRSYVPVHHAFWMPPQALRWR